MTATCTQCPVPSSGEGLFQSVAVHAFICMTDPNPIRYNNNTVHMQRQVLVVLGGNVVFSNVDNVLGYPGIFKQLLFLVLP